MGSRDSLFDDVWGVLLSLIRLFVLLLFVLRPIEFKLSMLLLLLPLLLLLLLMFHACLSICTYKPRWLTVELDHTPHNRNPETKFPSSQTLNRMRRKAIVDKRLAKTAIHAWCYRDIQGDITNGNPSPSTGITFCDVGPSTTQVRHNQPPG